MAYKRTFAVSISNSANVKSLSSGTKVANEVARKELDFWLPLTRPLLNAGVLGVLYFYNFPRHILDTFLVAWSRLYSKRGLQNIKS